MTDQPPSFPPQYDPRFHSQYPPAPVRYAPPPSVSPQGPAWTDVAVRLLGVLSVFLIAGLFVIIIRAQDFTGGSEPDPDATGAPRTGVLGQAARDGDFEFTVRSMSCGHKTLGKAKLTASYEFCVIEISVKNLADDEIRFDSGTNAQATGKVGNPMVDALGAEKTLAAEGNLHDPLNTRIGPGEQATLRLVYDSMAKFRPESIVPRSGYDSVGVSFPLG